MQKARKHVSGKLKMVTTGYVWVLVDIFSQHTCDRVSVVTGEFRDLDLSPAFVFQIVNR